MKLFRLYVFCGFCHPYHNLVQYNSKIIKKPFRLKLLKGNLIKIFLVLWSIEFKDILEREIHTYNYNMYNVYVNVRFAFYFIVNVNLCFVWHHNFPTQSINYLSIYQFWNDVKRLEEIGKDIWSKHCSYQLDCLAWIRIVGDWKMQRIGLCGELNSVFMAYMSQ